MPPEIGSEFHWDPAALSGGDATWLPASHELFATGCGALTALLRFLGPRGRLHLPSYFCMGVAEALAAVIPIAFYRHLPDEGGPRWPSLRAAAGDMVLSQNLFGRDDPRPWDAWMRANPEVVIIEDHSHDPLSDWARTSQASYAVASLRKTLPVPDGGLLWSPRGLDVPRPAGGESQGAQLKLAAMLLKAAWLDGRPIPKDDFRTLQQRGEHTLLGSEAPASAFTAAVLPLLDAPSLRRSSLHNARALQTLLLRDHRSPAPRTAPTPSWAGPSKAPGYDNSEPSSTAAVARTAPIPTRSEGPGLPGGGPVGMRSEGPGRPGAGPVGTRSGGWRLLGAGPFRAQLVCPSERVRDDLLRHLAANGIYAPVHWRQDRTALWSGDEESADLAARMLTVPVDHRCSATDVRRAAEVLLAFTDRQVERRAAAGPPSAA